MGWGEHPNLCHPLKMNMQIHSGNLRKQWISPFCFQEGQWKSQKWAHCTKNANRKNMSPKSRNKHVNNTHRACHTENNICQQQAYFLPSHHELFHTFPAIWHVLLGLLSGCVPTTCNNNRHLTFSGLFGLQFFNAMLRHGSTSKN